MHFTLNTLLPISILAHCNYTVILLLFILTVLCFFKIFKYVFLSAKVNPVNKAVFITGCDSGFGYNTAKRLDSAGFHVFASCLFPLGKNVLELQKCCSERMQILELDVTKDESVKKAVTFVMENLGTNDLWAVVNNAGVNAGFTMELSSLEDFKDCFEVNALGPVRVIKAFLPLLKKSKGRIINVTSLAVDFPVSFFCPYVMSKYAAQGFTDCIKEELDVWGIRVISILPDFFKTPLSSKEQLCYRLRSKYLSMDVETRNEFGDDYLNSFDRFLNTFLDTASSNIHMVVDVIESAVRAQNPQSKYVAFRSTMMRIVWGIFRIMPSHILRRIWSLVRHHFLLFPKPKYCQQKKIN